MNAPTHALTLSAEVHAAAFPAPRPLPVTGGMPE